VPAAQRDTISGHAAASLTSPTRTPFAVIRAEAERGLSVGAGNQRGEIRPKWITPAG
jgi:hypothetical protein